MKKIVHKKFELSDERFDEIMGKIYKYMWFREGAPSEGAIKLILENTIWEEIRGYIDE